MNNENQENEMSEIEKSERQVKQAGKDVARKTGKVLGDFAKKALKALIRAIGIKAILIGACIVIALFVVSCIWLAIKDFAL